MIAICKRSSSTRITFCHATAGSNIANAAVKALAQPERLACCGLVTCKIQVARHIPQTLLVFNKGAVDLTRFKVRAVRYAVLHKGEIEASSVDLACAVILYSNVAMACCVLKHQIVFNTRYKLIAECNAGAADGYTRKVGASCVSFARHILLVNTTWHSDWTLERAVS